MASEKPAKREIPRAYQTGRRSSSYLGGGGDRSSSDKDRSGGNLNLAWPWDRYSVMAARALVLTSVVYAAWRFGGVDATGRFHVSAILVLASILTLTSRRSFSRKSRRLPVLVFSLGLAWIVFGFFQAMPIASPLGIVFSGSASVKTHITDPAVNRLETAIEQIDEAQMPSRFEFFPSVVPHQTRQALVPFQLGFVMMVLSAILFESRQSRIVYLWVLIANTSLLAAWGIVQRAGGDVFILPGIENVFSKAPFSSFVYKNAGAAAILPGLAAIAALMYGKRSGKTRHSKSHADSKTLNQLGVFLLQPKILTLVALAGLLITGLISSLSRGAWFTAVVATAIACVSSRFKISKMQLLGIGAPAFLLVGGVIALTGIREAISVRANQVSVESFAGDQRWDHWKDGAQAAWFYAPGGSGIGTYGYATLPVQTQPHRSWFREAHNQYLEVLVESGLIGITFLLVAVVWFAQTSWKLLRQDSHREKSGWGLLGLLLLVCGGIQSAFDFVLLIPANLYLYASLIGVVAAAERSYAAYLKSHRSDRSFNDGAVNDPIRKTEKRYTIYRIPAIWCLVGIAMAASSSSVSYRNQQVEAKLAVLSERRMEEQPSLVAISSQLNRLNDAIQWQPERAELYRRRAELSFAKYRIQLLDLAEATGEPLGWQDTRPENLAATIAALDEASQASLIKSLLKTPEMRQQIAGAMKDLAKSLQRNPLDPSTHWACLSLSPMTEMPVEPWVESYAKLNLNDVNGLYSNGLVALQNGLPDLAIDQWSKSISVNRIHLDKIFGHASQSLPAIDIARHLIPPDRSDLFERLVEMANRESPMLAEDVGEELIQFLSEDTEFEDGPTNAALAGVYQGMGDDRRAVEHWKRALESNSKSRHYRWSYAQKLRQTGSLQEALQQSILGATLHPEDHRFDDLTLRIRQDIGSQRSFD